MSGIRIAPIEIDFIKEAIQSYFNDISRNSRSGGGNDAAWLPAADSRCRDYVIEKFRVTFSSSTDRFTICDEARVNSIVKAGNGALLLHKRDRDTLSEEVRCPKGKKDTISHKVLFWICTKAVVSIPDVLCCTCALLYYPCVVLCCATLALCCAALVLPCCCACAALVLCCAALVLSSATLVLCCATLVMCYAALVLYCTALVLCYPCAALVLCLCCPCAVLCCATLALCSATLVLCCPYALLYYLCAVLCLLPLSCAVLPRC
jgi:hypothetical protein